ncbi:SAM-dependent methyltransferase [Croceivirga thetidis]|uniref:SAM-dependent methyltransferase n=1 Tax=Croceivirga thetidis TaxID=2721623 RepID=A0ABX1GLY7_9FLAO|nr:SAM-dependent methyltransferase [Croceivirga thetidis]NKI30898.1 SAM-dependent methyltransferase [Croceivirga thetidis]
MSDILNAAYWDNRYQENQLGWDIGYISTPLKNYADQLPDKSIRILIPGGGNSYEAEYLYKTGFKNTFVVDLAQTAKDNFLERFPDFPENQFIVKDFFDLEGTYDLILEQTFFCALHPSFRLTYAKKMHKLLVAGGRLVGLLFDFPLNGGPPFGGTKEEYLGYFEPYFKVGVFEQCYNSIPPRKGKELFMNLVR